MPSLKALTFIETQIAPSETWTHLASFLFPVIITPLRPIYMYIYIYIYIYIYMCVCVCVCVCACTFMCVSVCACVCVAVVEKALSCLWLFSTRWYQTKYADDDQIGVVFCFLTFSFFLINWRVEQRVEEGGD